MAKKAKTIELMMQDLNELLLKLEDGEVTLEESFQYYAEGMKLIKECNTKIDKVEKEIIQLSTGGEEDGI